jgi:uncharacterized protein (DUF1330 family)
MTAYIVATVTIKDPEKFKAYLIGIAGLSEKHGGVALLRGVAVEIFEGDAAPGERIVVSEFPTIEAARGYLNSSEYQAARVHRLGAADVVIRLVSV